MEMVSPGPAGYRDLDTLLQGPGIYIILYIPYH